MVELLVVCVVLTTQEPNMDVISVPVSHLAGYDAVWTA